MLDATAQPAWIEVDANRRHGRPHIAGTRMRVADIVLLHLRLGQPLAEIAGRYDLPMAALHAAMAYYFDHRQAIDDSIEADRHFSEDLRTEHPSLLDAKLAAVHRG